MKMRHLCLLLIATTNMVPLARAQTNIQYGSGIPFAVNAPTSVDAGPLATSAQMSDNSVNEKFSDIVNTIQTEQVVQKLTSPHKITLKRFSAESASFFVAIAAVQLESLMMNFSDNPRALQDHFESIKDPIGHLSFYMFMQANGYTTNFLTNRLAPNMDPLAKTQALRGITYKGMAAGSIISSLTAEVATGVRDCAKMVFEKEKESKAEKKEICDAAFAQWTRSTKAQQYVSQIISLFVSQDAAQIIEMRGKQAIVWSSNRALSLAIKSTKVRKVLQVTALQVAMVVTPGGLTMKGLKIVGKIAQFTGFTFVDHLLAPLIHKAVANVWQPAQFSFDITNFNNNVFDAKRNLWKNNRSNEKLAESIAEMSKTMAEWRQAQLIQFKTSHGIWVENLMRVISQTNGTFGFYKTYVESLFSTENVKGDIRAGKLAATAMNHENGYPQRTLPLFGVTLKEAMPADYESPRDLTLNKPSDLESEQIKTVRDVNVDLKKLLATKGIHEHDAELLTQITTAFDSQDKNAIGYAIAKINDVVIYNKNFVTDVSLKESLGLIRKKLGDPYPILTPGMGFSYAYESHSFTAEAMKTFDHTKGPGNWLPRTSDYLLLQMVCGGESNLFDSNFFGFAPYFVSPKITKNSVRPDALCTSLNLKNLYSMKIAANDGKVYTGITQYINHNLREDVLGDLSDKKARAFGTWWTKNVNLKLGEMYETFDKEYVNVIDKMTQNWRGYGFVRKCLIDGRTSYSSCIGKVANTAVDTLNGNNYLDTNALMNLKFELDIYTSVLNELLLDTVLSNKVLSAETQRNLVGELLPLKASGQIPNVMQGSVPKASATELAEVKEVTDRAESINKAKKDFKGFLRRLRNGDRNILETVRMDEMVEIKNLRTAIEARLTILSYVEVKDGKVLNFPSKASSKKALDDLMNALTAVQAKCSSLLGDEAQKKSEDSEVKGIQKTVLSPSQKAIFDAANAGIQSIVGEISSLNMALYTSKYKLSDSYEDLISGLKSGKGKEAVNGKQGSNPFGGK